MNWINSFVRPKIKEFIGERKERVKENTWYKCPDCNHLSYQRELIQNHYVCSKCPHHFRMPVNERLRMIYDNSEFEIQASKSNKDDPLNFRDQKRYSDRLKQARQKTGAKDSVIIANGKIGGFPCVTSIFDFDFMGGSMGSAAGNAVVKAIATAIDHRAALLLITASGGARMQEGVVSLMQLPRTIIAVQQLREQRLPYLVLLTNPTMGGVTASCAMLGDIQIAEPKAVIGFAGRRVVMETARVSLPDDFQTAEFNLAKGFVDQIVHRHELRPFLSTMLELLVARDNSSTAKLNSIANAKQAPDDKSTVKEQTASQ